MSFLFFPHGPGISSSAHCPNNHVFVTGHTFHKSLICPSSLYKVPLFFCILYTLYCTPYHTVFLHHGGVSPTVTVYWYLVLFDTQYNLLPTTWYSTLHWPSWSFASMSVACQPMPRMPTSSVQYHHLLCLLTSFITSPKFQHPIATNSH